MSDSAHTGPWRDVVHIEQVNGVRGGSFWKLQLDECNHIVYRSKGNSKPFIKVRRLAPKRVRCIWCSIIGRTS